MTRLFDQLESSSKAFRFAVALKCVALALLLWALVSEQVLTSTSKDLMTLVFVAVSVAVAIIMRNRQQMMRQLRSRVMDDAVRAADFDRDVLTSALSRRRFLRELRECVRSESRQSESTALFLIDLDHFKKLNDSYGHKMGDAALVHLVAKLREILPTATIGRLGGDEFAAFLPVEGKEDAFRSAERLITSLGKPLVVESRQIGLSVSIGIAVSPDHSSLAEDLVLLADLALYKSKRDGRCRATVFDSDLQKTDRYRRLIERELRAAILLGKLEVHYQPIVDAGKDVQGVEALVRWCHDTRGLVSPGEFISIAEDSVLIDQLGEFVFRRACLDLDHLPGRHVTVNVSAAQLQRNTILEMTERVLRETGREATSFVLEITENIALAATAEVMARISALRSAGFRIALDDFGTGHCSFVYLRRFPVDIVKIDRSYISTLASDPISGIFVSSLAEVGRLLDMVILAEGIETEAEFELSKSLGCTRFQGFHFARPQPIGAYRPDRKFASQAAA